VRLLALIVCVACSPPPTPPVKKPVGSATPTSDTPPPREYPPVTVRKARSRFTLEVLGAEAVGTIDPGATKVAHTLTVGLRALAGTDTAITLGKKNVDLIDVRTMVGCSNVDLACAKKIAATLPADKLIYGIVNDLGEGDYYVVLTLFDTKAGTEVKWSGRTQSGDPDLVYTAKVAFDSLIWQGT
jgi:hypothetical protein